MEEKRVTALLSGKPHRLEEKRERREKGKRRFAFSITLLLPAEERVNI